MITALLTLGITLSCLFAAPVDGPAATAFAPSGAYGGHWGLDFAVVPGTPVRAAAAGSVTFAGSVAGMLSVTVHHGGGVRTSYSFLSRLGVTAGSRVGRGDVVGYSGTDHGSNLHWSLRVDDRYLDPALACVPREVPGMAVRLAGVRWAVGPYPLRRAPRHPWRNLRPSSLRPPHRR